MRITREKLIELARKEAEHRAASGQDVLSAYLIGSVAHGEPLLGGTTDIDLILIHEAKPTADHEIQSLSQDVHLDIRHHPLSLYAQPPSLRLDPWLGPALCEPVFLFDPHHHFERAQAGVRGQFYRPDHVLARARAFLQQARAKSKTASSNGEWPDAYVEACMLGANAGACLAGPPAAGRRLSLTLQHRSQDLGHPEIHAAFLRLLGAEPVPTWDFPHWLSAWSRTWRAAADASPAPERHFARRHYFQTGIQAMAEDHSPQAALWALLSTWVGNVRALASYSLPPSLSQDWETFLQCLSLDPAHIAARADELESFLDHVEGVLEEWGEQNGA